MGHAQADCARLWDDDARCCSPGSGSTSDDSPILAYRCEKRRWPPAGGGAGAGAVVGGGRRGPLTALSRLGVCCAAVIVFCVLMYIPVYNRANYHMLKKGFVPGWPIHTNRDTKIYVQPYNVTTLYEPKHVCVDSKKNSPKKLFLLIIVCSSTENFEKRKTIRETWGHYENYKKNLVVFKQITEKYKNYSYQYDLYPLERDKLYTTVQLNVSNTDNHTTQDGHRNKRDISSINQLLPVLAKAVGNISLDGRNKVPESERETYEKRFEDDDDPLIPGFDMERDIPPDDEQFTDYNYDTNIMKIPSRGDGAEENADLDNILNIIKQNKVSQANTIVNNEEDPDFRLVFLVGTSSKENSTVQKKIEEEIETYDDIVQEDFIDSYNNLTLKSIMMLKWVTNKCNDSVRYILKLDDDTYLNVPSLVVLLRNRSAQWDADNPLSPAGREYLLMGHLISGAKPIHTLDHKWYSPRYMFSGRVYPRYLSGGAGYCMSLPTARALYHAALATRLFHLEDIYITGMCALRASPRQAPRMEPLFTFFPARDTCWSHAHVTSHRVAADSMRHLDRQLRHPGEVDRCERIRLTKIRNDRIQQQRKLKKAKKKHKWI